MTFELLIYNIQKEQFFTEEFKGDRYATAHTKAEKKYSSELFYIVGENTHFTKYKGILNAWLTPTGELIPCGYMNHSVWAGEFMNECGWMIEKYDYPYQTLCKKGWLRLLNWKSDALLTVLIGDDYHQLPNELQSQTAKDWCIFNNVPFKNLFKDNTNKSLGLYLNKYE